MASKQGDVKRVPAEREGSRDPHKVAEYTLSGLLVMLALTFVRDQVVTAAGC
jgi:hypothetical protein